jgi:hypothetical protein
MKPLEALGLLENLQRETKIGPVITKTMTSFLKRQKRLIINKIKMLEMRLK